MSELDPAAGGGRENSPKEDDDQTPSGTLHSTHLEAIYQRVEYHESLSILPVDDLERIERLAPGSTQKLVDLAIKQAENRMSMESKIIEKREPRATRAQVFSFILILSDLIATTLLIAIGQAPYGFLVFLVMVTAVVVISIWNRYQDRRERVEKAQLPPRPSQPTPDSPSTGHPPPLPLAEASELPEIEPGPVGSDQVEPPA